MKNGPQSLKSRKIVVLASDGVSMDLVNGLKAAVKAEGALIEVFAPMVGGVEADEGSLVEGDQKVDGGPSVLYDAVAVLLSAEGPKPWPRIRRPRTSSPTHSPIASSPTTKRQCSCSRRPGSPPTRTRVSFGSTRAGDAEGFIATAREVGYWPREKVLK